MSATVAAVNGIATFGSSVFNTAGTYALSASSSGLTSATSPSFTISPLSASKLAFNIQPSSGVAGMAISPIAVQVQDQYGNVVTGTNSVTVTSSPAGVSSTVAAVNGVATFNNLAFAAAQSYTLLASSSGLSGSTSSSFTISAGNASKMVCTSQPVNSIAGAALAPVVVQVQDTNGNLVSTSNASIDLASNPAGVSATIASSGGVATFGNLAFNVAGSFTLTFSSTGLGSAISNSFTISAGNASRLVFTTQPANGLVGSAISPVALQVQDTFGNLVMTSNPLINLTSVPSAVSSTVTAQNGVATFNNLVFGAVGSYQLAAVSTGLSGAFSTVFTTSIANPSKLQLSTQPSNSTAGTSFPPMVVQVEDGSGNLVIGSNASVTITSSPVGVNATAAAVNGVATFSGLLFSSAGTYSLTASSPGLASAVSNPFNVTILMTAAKSGVFRNGAQFLEDSNGNGTYDGGLDKFIPSFIPPGGGQAGDVPVSGDWTGDGHTKVGLYRPSAGTWWLDANNDGIFNAGDFTYQFGGVPGDLPVVGDWNAVAGTFVHKTCIGIYRAQGSVWLLDLNCNGTFDDTPIDAFFPFGGLAGDVPVVGAWTGTQTRVGVVRKYAPGGVPQGNPFYWVPDGGAANAGNLPVNHPADVPNCFGFGGLANDVFVTGDWYDKGTAAAGVYRAGFWVLDAALPGTPQSNNVPGLTFGYGGVRGRCADNREMVGDVTGSSPTRRTCAAQLRARLNDESAPAATQSGGLIAHSPAKKEDTGRPRPLE